MGQLVVKEADVRRIAVVQAPTAWAITCLRCRPWRPCAPPIPRRRSCCRSRPGTASFWPVILTCHGVGAAEHSVPDAVALKRFFAARRDECYDIPSQLHSGGRYSNPFVRRLGTRLGVGLKTHDAAAAAVDGVARRGNRAATGRRTSLPPSATPWPRWGCCGAVTWSTADSSHAAATAPPYRGGRPAPFGAPMPCAGVAATRLVHCRDRRGGGQDRGRGVAGRRRLMPAPCYLYFW